MSRETVLEFRLAVQQQQETTERATASIGAESAVERTSTLTWGKAQKIIDALGEKLKLAERTAECTATLTLEKAQTIIDALKE